MKMMKILLFSLSLLFYGDRPAAEGQIKYKSVKNGSTVTLKCDEMSKGPVIWSRDRAGRREDILTIEDGGRTTKHINDTHKFYHTSINRSLMITRVSSFHAGLYYCNSTAVVCLTVTSGPAMTNQDKCDARSAENKISGYWIILIVVGSVVLLLVLTLVSTRKWFLKKDAEGTETADHVYASIDHDASRKAQTGILIKERNKESIYYLANHPDPVPTGLQNELTYSEIQDPANRLQNNSLQNEFTYSLLQNPANKRQNNGPVGEEVYSLAQRPRSAAEDPETPGTTD
ncbi:uncharacterized protein LOC108410941 isoform X1 [Pygocentrus nattereri]|uniref:uncharacterized protein LOC108410941 isoform X1 n=1 Tax=Pygocentrus nattereri TaxID=42514 RepID=UPI000814602B|nr:uncharacterized protein LOC108410941 isoform X1 [Pygocentrus nattereri]